MPGLAATAWSVMATVLAWLAGLGVVALAWPARIPLPWLPWAGLGGLVGPGIVGLAFMATGMAGVPAAAALPAIGLAALCTVTLGLSRRAGVQRVALRGIGAPRHAVACSLILAGTVAWTGSLALRTHLGWDGTVVWYQKARVLAATGGVMPAATLADATRGWTAPDYPLHVPSAMAWVRAWQPVEDERAAKWLQVGWCAALLFLLFAAVASQPDAGQAGPVRGAAAVLLAATCARLVVGEGSLTSGYADGPMAGLLLALLWLARRSAWGAERQWIPVLALMALLLAWTKQEGLVGVLVVATVMALGRQSAAATWVAVPALILSAAWTMRVWLAGAPSGIAYEWRGLDVAAARLGPVIQAYAHAWADWQAWGLFWPVVGGLALWAGREARTRRVLAVVVALTTTGALAFLFSDWPDVREHLAVTVPRQLIQVAPTLVWCACVGPRPLRPA